MALTKYGYTGTVNQAQWAKLHGIAALNYATAKAADHAPSAVGGLRRLSVAAGTTEGYGVGVVTDAATLIDFAAPAAGAWYLVSILRDWTTPANTAFVSTVHETLTANTPVPTVPPVAYPAAISGNVANLNGNAGTLQDYEPMFWVWVNNLNTNLVIIDLRTFALNTRIAAVEVLTAPALADLAALPAASGFSEGRRFHIDSLNVDFEQLDGAWVQQGVATVADASTRNTEYAKASGVYLKQGAQVRRLDAAWVEEYFALYNSGTNPQGAASAGWYPITGRLPFVSLGMTTAQNFTNTGTNVAVPWDTELSDLLDWHSTVTNPSRITVQQAGRYRVTRTLTSSQPLSASAYMAGDFAVNGTLLRGSYKVTPSANSVFPADGHSMETVLAAGDYIECRGSTPTTGPYPVRVAECLFQLSYLSAA